ncbi:hypothetical protein P175DRAFT_0320515 [Aspergillus ochraceoroseus IBT 24754]|uniref:Uncharacterized protein n=1 Tax=Aspergillus ochraceoroseus IBT 24754 TaxID=1392256 RepID=A0A2T5LQR0_9EURO|nr:uncharacterized protein P175DRAFT_0320515 [Aspergillus ochraceoroseus IBT 24754]PTU18618.1 hypothetical protein P175DRAFT_0320515 [Aspergillus ochraceoroseus IBT 24754]
MDLKTSNASQLLGFDAQTYGQAASLYPIAVCMIPVHMCAFYAGLFRVPQKLSDALRTGPLEPVHLELQQIRWPLFKSQVLCSSILMPDYHCQIVSLSLKRPNFLRPQRCKNSFDCIEKK